MSAVTLNAVRGAFARVVAAAQEAGLDSRNWALIEGSATYGHAFRIVERDPVSGGHSRPTGLSDSHLGMTRRDAHHRLEGMRVAFMAATERREGAPVILTDEPGRIFKLTGLNSILTPGPAKVSAR